MKKILKKVMNFIMVAIVATITTFGLMTVITFIVDGKIKLSSEDCVILLFMDLAMVIGYYGKMLVTRVKDAL